jgi:hypothetical protein
MSFFSDSPTDVFQGGRNNSNSHKANDHEGDHSTCFKKFTKEWLPSDDFFQTQKTKDNDVSSFTSSSFEIQPQASIVPLIPQKNFSGKTHFRILHHY